MLQGCWYPGHPHPHLAHHGADIHQLLTAGCSRTCPCSCLFPKRHSPALCCVCDPGSFVQDILSLLMAKHFMVGSSWYISFNPEIINMNITESILQCGSPQLSSVIHLFIHCLHIKYNQDAITVYIVVSINVLALWVWNDLNLDISVFSCSFLMTSFLDCKLGPPVIPL